MKKKKANKVKFPVMHYKKSLVAKAYNYLDNGITNYQHDTEGYLLQNLRKKIIKTYFVLFTQIILQLVDANIVFLDLITSL